MSQDPPKKRDAHTRINVFYDHYRDKFWYRLNGHFASLKVSDLRLHFRVAGLTEMPVGNGLREIDWPIWNAQAKNMVAFAGPLAGYRVGVHSDDNGQKFLVTSEAKGVWDDLPKKVQEPAFFKSFVEELLGPEQSLLCCYWLGIALKAMRECQTKVKGQAVVFAGPARCGKSFFQDMITQILGGRSADPFAYLMGESKFNNELSSSEHWQIQDPPSSTDIRTRRLFGEKLKEATVNRLIKIEGKGKDALSFELFRRVTISVNEEIECLSVIPPLEEGIVDKVIAFKCAAVQEAFKPFFVQGNYVEQKCWNAFMQELPHIRAWLLKWFTADRVPKELGGDTRFKVRAWQHPEILAELHNMAPEMRLLQLIDQIIFDGKEVIAGAWEGKSLALEKELKASDYGFEVEKILRRPDAAGTYLSRIMKKIPGRISKRVVRGTAVWTIEKPPKEKETNGIHETQ